MESIKQLFAYMNDVSFEYVVLRNWDNLPYDVQLGEHSDLDLLVYDFNHFREIFPQAKLEYAYPRVRMKIPIADSFLYIDVRHVGDDYYPEEFERAILATRELNPLGFYTPDALHHRIALAYHAVHHKNSVARDYTRWLGSATVEDLLAVLKESSVGWVEPKDKSVGRFNGYFKGCTSVVEKRDGLVLKKQVAYTDWNLINAEKHILSQVSSIHFPTCFPSLSDSEIALEDCGDLLGADNLPWDWESQLFEVLTELKRFRILHRDIRLENLMVKDGVIKLIDFGWAVFEDQKEAQEPPSCLGFPNKPSNGFDDAFSMKRVIKQINYLIEDKEDRAKSDKNKETQCVS